MELRSSITNYQRVFTLDDKDNYNHFYENNNK